MTMTYHNMLFALVLLCAVWAVMSRTLLTSAIMLALVSVFTAVILFDFSAPWAGVFELSVCAGLITVLFIGAVSLVRGSEEGKHENRVPYRILPLVLAAVAIAAWYYVPPFFDNLAGWRRMTSPGGHIGLALWQLRKADILGQVAILAAGVLVIKSIFPAKKAGLTETSK